MAQITGSPGTPVIEAVFSGETGKVSVDIQHVRQDAQIEQIMLVINNEVVSTIKSTPLEFNIEDIPDGEHWVKVRAVYRSGTNEVIIESPYYRQSLVAIWRSPTVKIIKVCKKRGTVSTNLKK
jgi:hypothetical protein